MRTVPAAPRCTLRAALNLNLKVSLGSVGEKPSLEGFCAALDGPAQAARAVHAARRARPAPSLPAVLRSRWRARAWAGALARLRLHHGVLHAPRCPPQSPGGGPRTSGRRARACACTMASCTRPMRSYTSGSTRRRASTARSSPSAAGRAAAAAASASAQPSRKRSWPVLGLRARARAGHARADALGMPAGWARPAGAPASGRRKRRATLNRRICIYRPQLVSCVPSPTHGAAELLDCAARCAPAGRLELPVT